MKLIHHSVVALSLFGILVANSTSAQVAEHLPKRAFSIADDPSGKAVAGPLFRKMETAIAAANTGDGAGFDAFLAPNASSTLHLMSTRELRQTPFTATTIQAATKSCIGPYPFDEGPFWVQLSWVCRTDKEAPLSSMVTFRDSPELSLTVWFEGNLIRYIDAGEPIYYPRARRLDMNAYAIMQSKP
jgi:hypothetical protein